MNLRTAGRSYVASALIVIASFAARAAPPTFTITEIYSGPDYQFVRLTETAGKNGQQHFAGLKLTTTHNGIVKEYTFPHDLPTDRTANLSIVIATTGMLSVADARATCWRCYAPEFSTLPSDQFLPENGTIDFAGTDTLTYSYLPYDGLAGLYRDGTMRRGTVPGNGQCLLPPGNSEDPLRCLDEYLITSDWCDDCSSISPSWITGSWFDPTQSGHGLMIQVLPDNRFYATWLAFNPAGTEQAWFSGVGTTSGNTATITTVHQPAGGRWIPDFKPDRVALNGWGTLTFTFTDCNHGKVDFNSVAGYGTGSMKLARLTQPAGLTC
jgi:hypothetical protein